MVPSADLQSEQPVTPYPPPPPLAISLTNAWQLGRAVYFYASASCTDRSNDFDCMSALHSLAEVSPKAADTLLAFATGNAATRQSVLDLAAGKAELTESIPEKAVERFAAASEEFITFDDPAALEEVLARGTLEQWQWFPGASRSAGSCSTVVFGPGGLRGSAGQARPSLRSIGRNDLPCGRDESERKDSFHYLRQGSRSSGRSSTGHAVWSRAQGHRGYASSPVVP